MEVYSGIWPQPRNSASNLAWSSLYSVELALTIETFGKVRKIPTLYKYVNEAAEERKEASDQ